MLAEVSVPPTGDAADGVTGAAGPCTGCKFVVVFCFEVLLLDGFATTVKVANETPAIHNRREIKLRVVTKPDVGRVFFMAELTGLAESSAMVVRADASRTRKLHDGAALF
jgi:hypothetical protein